MESLPSGSATDRKRPLRARIMIATALFVAAAHVLLPHVLPQGLTAWPLLVARTVLFVVGAGVILALSRGLPWVLCALLAITWAGVGVRWYRNAGTAPGDPGAAPGPSPAA